MAEPVLRAERFGYTYPERPALALRDVTLELAPGSFTVVAGASGSGKSTLLRAACGLVPHFHEGEATGELEVAGLSLRDNGPAELSALCGTVFQDPETQVVMGGVHAEIALPLEHRGESAPSVARAVEETALELGIAHMLGRRTDSLSSGELQRVALAAALVTRPRLLVLDEPTSQLDPVAGDELVWLLRRLNEEAGTAVLLAEHRLERCLAAADRVVALDGGRVACDAPPDEFLAWAEESAPTLATPLARLFSTAGLRPAPASVKAARAGLRAVGLIPPRGAERRSAIESDEDRSHGRGRLWHARRAPASRAALELRDVWHELREGPAVLRGVDLRFEPGERVALLGRNGAGKSTLLRHARGLLEPTRGRVERAGEVALLLQNPGDYLVHERVDEEVDATGLAAAGLADRPGANPRDLSGGERQRLALETVLPGAADVPGGVAPPAAVLLDEPTRGMDRAPKDALGERLRSLAAAGAAALVATHDTAGSGSRAGGSARSCAGARLRWELPAGPRLHVAEAPSAASSAAGRSPSPAASPAWRTGSSWTAICGRSRASTRSRRTPCSRRVRSRSTWRTRSATSRSRW